MKFMIEFRLKPGSKKKAMEIFETRGPNRTPGVSLRQAWVGTKADLVFVLAESESESLVSTAAQSWSEHGESQIHAVIDIEQY
jgi:hypothetical protein